MTIPGDLGANELFGPLFATDRQLEALGAAAWVQAMLDAEAALAHAEADVGLVPAAAAEAIAAACRAERFDAARLGRAARDGGNPVIPLAAALEAAVPESARPWVHHGATSQDILDTAAVLVARRALVIVEGDLRVLAGGCAALAEQHRHTLMAGRTLLQQALPITFGLKAAGWLVGVLDARRLLVDAGGRLAVQLGGAAGTLASLGDAGPSVLTRFAVRLELPEPLVPWHTARQRVAELASALALTTGTTAKIAGDVGLLAQSEVGEAAEPAGPGRGGSSTLPQKRNPVGAALARAAAARAQALSGVLLGALVAEHERPLGAWHSEWQPLTELLGLCSGAVARTAETVAGLEVDAEAMAANLARGRGTLLAERVSLALSPALGRRTAHEVVAGAVRRSLDRGTPLAEELRGDPSVGSALAPDAHNGEEDAVGEEHAAGERRLDVRLAELLDPAGYLGATDTWIDRALSAHAALAEGP
jgi:3-carboxy-cis,cis-muconate cycloisomerase